MFPLVTQPKHIVCPHCHAVNRVPSERLGDEPACGQCREPLFVAPPPELSGGTFQKHISRNDMPVVVDFWAPWCGPCKMMAPAFEQASTELATSARFVKLNTDAEQGIAAEFGIRSIPTMIIFRNGAEIARQPGAMGAADIVRWVRQNTG